MKEHDDPKKPTDPALIKELMELRRTNPDKFMEMVFSSLSSFPELALEDGEDPKKKLDAIQKVIDHYQATEQYEKCEFLKRLMEVIKDADDKQKLANLKAWKRKKKST